MKAKSFGRSSGAAASHSAGLCTVAAVSAYADGGLSSGTAVAAVTSGAYAASTSMATDRGRADTDGMGISAPAAAFVIRVVPDAKKLTSHGLHSRGVHNACYPFKMVRVHVDVFRGLLRQLAQFIPLRPA